ncbi:DEAD/DEAH box helicase [Lacihabitans soyangensis]|uniref:DEAD/DEAH box helicase n=1 Tax=Lacihabitans soyangensis TaxID=869394 RepID=A0AAE3H0T2_9BACT|nr:DEAD/DEAH box helicase [Lacihabitans soyangensis]MCP9762200.1 DEAD/DEAH box helicase [Lacihabitans soyangensis]
MHPQTYILKNHQVATLTYADTFRYGVEISSGLKNVEVQPLNIEIDNALFALNSQSKNLPDVAVSQIEADLVLTCGCGAVKNTLCEHQTLVLQTLISKPDFKAFFDKNLRLEKIKKAAEAYGMAEEEDLEKYFGLKYADRQTYVVPLNPELIPVDEKSTSFFKSKLFAKNVEPSESEKGETKQQIIVFRRNKFQETYSLELYDATLAKNGKIKAPFSQLDPLNEVWNHEKPEMIRFFTALAKVQKNSEWNDNQAIDSIVKNPLSLNFYLSENDTISANNLISVKLENASVGLNINVNLKEPFYEVTTSVTINEHIYALQDLKIRFNCFFQTGDRLVFISDVEMLPVIKYFAEKRAIMLIYPSKFELFRKEILDAMSDKVSIAYAFIKKKKEEKSVEWESSYEIEKLIYLTDQKNFVNITPVMKYGQLEVAVHSKKQLIDVDPNGNHFSVERDDTAELNFTSMISRLHPEFSGQLADGNYFYLHKQKFLDDNWFLDFFEILRENNVKVLGFNSLTNNKLSPYKASVEISVASGIDWFDTKVKLKFGKKDVPLKVLHKSLRNKSKFVELDDGTLGLIPEEWIKKFNNYFKAGKLEGALIRTPKSRFLDIPDLYETEVLSKEAWAEISYLKSKFEHFDTIEEVEVPGELNATLRDYQKHGLNWLNFLDGFNFGACLADDMGLGKTIQIIAFLLIQKQKLPEQQSLIIVPTSLMFNWLDEFSRFAPSLKIASHYGNTKLNSKEEIQGFDVVLTTYGTLLSDLHFLKNITFNYIILDESQAIKNPESQRYRAARMLVSRNKIVLTGTPIENNTYDLYGQLSFACPNLLGSKSYFKDIYAEPIDKFKESRRAEELRKKISPFILRRTKKQVIEELPSKTEMLIYCEMALDQRAIYDTHEAELRDYLQHKTEEEISPMHVLTGLTKLRQICDSPSLLPDDEYPNEVSSKIDVLLEQIEGQIGEHKILIFSQFVGMLDLIKKSLVARNINFEYLTGQTKNRAEKVKNFQENPDVRVFLISLKAGGVGLNLTEADYVYLVDPWWNPAVENQAIDRVYRIGQKNKVIAVRLICPNTIEEKMLKLQSTKKDLAGKLVNTEADIFKAFNRKELLEILGR